MNGRRTMAPRPPGRGKRRFGDVGGEVVAGLAAAVILSTFGLIWTAVTSDAPRTVLLSTGAVGLVLAQVALLAWTVAIWRPIPKPSWFGVLLAATGTAIVVSTTAMGIAAVLGDEARPGDNGEEIASCDPPVRLELPDDAIDSGVVTIDVACPAPDGQTYHVISEIVSIDPSNPHPEYYVIDLALPSSGVTHVTWNIADDLQRRLYVVAVTPSQEAELTRFYDAGRRLVLELPAGLAPISNVLDHPAGEGRGGG
jgi:hypothetical protein